MRSSRCFVALSAVVISSLGCGKSTVSVVPLAPGSQCPNGGVSISVDDGSAQVVCNGATGDAGPPGPQGDAGAPGPAGDAGANGATTLIKTVVLSPGDPNCPGGGEEIESGLDDGADGAVANDGILEPGEVTEVSYVCASDGPHVGSFDPPAGAEGTALLDLHGGDTDGGQGGNGGSFSASFVNGSNGGHIKLFQTGAADASFTAPTLPGASLGAAPATVTANATLTAEQSSTPVALTAGALFVNANGNGALYISNGPLVPATLATSLTVAAGATLTVETGETPIDVPGPVLNSGAITVGASSQIIDLTCSDYYGASTAQLTNDGAAGSASGDGAGANDIFLVADQVWNEGLISASGGSGANGGGGGTVALGPYAGQFDRPSRRASGASRELASSGVEHDSILFNLGTIRANGGDALSGGGGAAGHLILYSAGDLDNSGAISANGGQGFGGTHQGVGGAAGEIDLYAGYGGYPGSLRNSGALGASGGSVDASCVRAGDVTCDASGGGTITLTAENGVLVSSGAISASGGLAHAGSGGPGGALVIALQSASNAITGGAQPLVPAGDISISGAINVAGGSGAAAAGSGGAIAVSLDPGELPEGQEIAFYGYASLDLRGGAGVVSGGAGGSLSLTNALSQTPQNTSGATIAGPGGGVVNAVDVFAGGGSTSGGGNLQGAGGAGGQVQMKTQLSLGFDDTYERLINTGAIDTSGGSGTSGGTAGFIGLYGLEGASNSGAITATGGQGTAGAGGAGSAGDDSDTLGFALLAADGPALSGGTIDLSGGSGTTSGGAAGWAAIIGTNATLSGTIQAAGGAGVNNLAAAPGGVGGQVSVSSISGTSEITIAAPAGISVPGGAGSAGSAAAGNVIIDGWDVTESWTY